jgi:hypothetical protein
LTESFDESTAAVLATLADTGAMERTVTLAAGLSFPSRAQMSDSSHRATPSSFAWDLAVATKQSTDLTPEPTT